MVNVKLPEFIEKLRLAEAIPTVKDFNQFTPQLKIVKHLLNRPDIVFEWSG